MITSIHRSHNTLSHRILSAFIAFSFIFSLVLPPGYAQLVPQTLLNLPAPGTMVAPTAAFTPALINGITIHPENPLEFDFIVGTGDDKLQGKAFEEESTKLIKYFLASLTVPEDEMWVNLSPYEKDRIIPQEFGTTEMGRDLLAQDYILKQLTASLMYPEKELGKKFWDKIYSKAREQYGTTEIPLNTFNKVWIVPEKAVVYEHGNSAFVVKSRLKVMLEEDYIAGSGQRIADRDEKLAANRSALSAEIIREIILPAIEQEVNEGKSFANLRQIYNSAILAAWFKQNLKETLLGQVYVDKAKTKGVDVDDKTVNEKIYAQYLEAFKKGVYNYIKEDYDPATQEIVPRKYFSGGTNLKIENLLETYKKDQSSSPLQQPIIEAFLAGQSSEQQEIVSITLLELSRRMSVEETQRLIQESQQAVPPAAELEKAKKDVLARIKEVKELLDALQDHFVEGVAPPLPIQAYSSLSDALRAATGEAGTRKSGDEIIPAARLFNIVVKKELSYRAQRMSRILDKNKVISEADKQQLKEKLGELDKVLGEFKKFKSVIFQAARLDEQLKRVSGALNIPEVNAFYEFRNAVKKEELSAGLTGIPGKTSEGALRRMIAANMIYKARGKYVLRPYFLMSSRLKKFASGIPDGTGGSVETSILDSVDANNFIAGLAWDSKKSEEEIVEFLEEQKLLLPLAARWRSFYAQEGGEDALRETVERAKGIAGEFIKNHPTQDGEFVLAAKVTPDGKSAVVTTAVQTPAGGNEHSSRILLLDLLKGAVGIRVISDESDDRYNSSFDRIAFFDGGVAVWNFSRQLKWDISDPENPRPVGWQEEETWGQEISSSPVDDDYDKRRREEVAYITNRGRALRGDPDFENYLTLEEREAKEKEKAASMHIDYEEWKKGKRGASSPVKVDGQAAVESFKSAGFNDDLVSVISGTLGLAFDVRRHFQDRNNINKDESIIMNAVSMLQNNENIRAIKAAGEAGARFNRGTGEYSIVIAQDSSEVESKSALSVGTMLGVYKQEKMIGAIFFLNGPVTTMAVTDGKTITHYAYDGEQFINRRDIAINLGVPTAKDSPAALGGVYTEWPRIFQDYYRQHGRGIPGSTASVLKTRYSGVLGEDGLVHGANGANLYEILVNNGFMTEIVNLEQAKILSLFAEGAGGAAFVMTSDGPRSPGEIQGEIPVIQIYLGNKDAVEKLRLYFQEKKAGFSPSLVRTQFLRAAPEFKSVSSFHVLKLEDFLSLKIPAMDERADLIGAVAAVAKAAQAVGQMYVAGARATGAIDSAGAKQLAIDEQTDQLFMNALKPWIREYYSEDMGYVIDFNGDGIKLMVMIDALDGSSRVKGNGGAGTIVSLREYDSKKIVASLIVVHGVTPKLVFAMADIGVFEFVLERENFYGSRLIYDLSSAKLPGKGLRVALGGERPVWPEGFAELVDEWTDRGAIPGYSGALVTDIYGAINHMLDGGHAIFAYPANKLRVKSELQAIAYLFRVAGGANLTYRHADGKPAQDITDLLDVELTPEPDPSKQQKAPSVFGSRGIIQEVKDTLAPASSSASSPVEVAAGVAGDEGGTKRLRTFVEEALAEDPNYFLVEDLIRDLTNILVERKHDTPASLEALLSAINFIVTEYSDIVLFIPSDLEDAMDEVNDSYDSQYLETVKQLFEKIWEEAPDGELPETLDQFTGIIEAYLEDSGSTSSPVAGGGSWQKLKNRVWGKSASEKEMERAAKLAEGIRKAYIKNFDGLIEQAQQKAREGMRSRDGDPFWSDGLVEGFQVYFDPTTRTILIRGEKVLGQQFFITQDPDWARRESYQGRKLIGNGIAVLFIGYDRAGKSLYVVVQDDTNYHNEAAGPAAGGSFHAISESEFTNRRAKGEIPNDLEEIVNLFPLRDQILQEIASSPAAEGLRDYLRDRQAVGEITPEEAEFAARGVNDWLTRPGYPQKLVAKLRQMIAAQNWAVITEGFYRVLPFGTAGKRGTQVDKQGDILPGSNYINDYTVAEYTLGLARYLLKTGQQDRGVVLGGDTRIKSILPYRGEESYVELQAKILRKMGIKVYRFKEPRSIGHVAWTAVANDAASMEYNSASHNMWTDNGVKASNEFGAQLFADERAGILEEIDGVESEDIAAMNLDEFDLEVDRGQNPGMHVLLGSKEDRERDPSVVDADSGYIEANRRYVENMDVIRGYSSQVHSFYTPIHGAGVYTIPNILTDGGDFEFQVVLSQEQRSQDAQGRFGTVEKPDPNYVNEKTGARTLDTALREAEEMEKNSGAKFDFVFGTDPDADRSSYAVRDREGEWKVLKANEVWSLFAWYRLTQLARQWKLKTGTWAIETWVTTDLIAEIVQDPQFNLRVLKPAVGFNKIAEVALREIVLPVLVERHGRGDLKELQRMKVLTLEKLARIFGVSSRKEMMGEINAVLKEFLLFGAEESNGYSPGGHTLEKDGAVAAVTFHEIAAFVKSINQNKEKAGRDDPYLRSYFDTFAGRDLTIDELLNRVYLQYGYYATENIPLSFPGLTGDAQKKQNLQKLADLAAKVNDGKETVTIGDQRVQKAFSGKEQASTDNVQFNEPGYKFMLGEKDYIATRPSGTEPYIRFYGQKYVPALELSWDNIEVQKRKADNEIERTVLAAQKAFVPASSPATASQIRDDEEEGFSPPAEDVGRNDVSSDASSPASSSVSEERVQTVARLVGMEATSDKGPATKGGIDLNPALLDLQIKRDGNGVPLPLPMQPIEHMHIEGFLPIIINITPVTNLPLLLGLADAAAETQAITATPDLKAREVEPVSLLN